MSPTTIGIIGILIMLAIFMTKMPVAYVMTLVGFVGFGILISFPAALALLPRNFYDSFSSYELTTIPLFVLMGQLAFNGGISRKLYNTAYSFLGNIKGGLAMATVSTCTAFGAVCGSSPATAATMATVGMPEMKRFGYADSLSAGSVASGGGLGMIMPPSVVLIIYGILTEQSIGALFVSGILPAFLMTFLFIVCVYITCRIDPKQGPKGREIHTGAKDKIALGACRYPGGFRVGHEWPLLRFFHPNRISCSGSFRCLARIHHPAATHLEGLCEISVRDPPDIHHDSFSHRRCRGFRKISRSHPHSL